MKGDASVHAGPEAPKGSPALRNPNGVAISLSKVVNALFTTFVSSPAMARRLTEVRKKGAWAGAKTTSEAGKAQGLGS
jgi:hypothetical protein